MCSSTRGPAMAPSLVTWPTSSSAVLRRRATSISAWAEARTWATDPAAESRPSRCTVWIESTTATSPRLESVAAISPAAVAAASATGASAMPSRRARRAICETASSPVT